MLSRGCEGWVRDRRNGDFQKRLLGESPVFGVIGGPLQIVERRADVNDAAQRLRWIIQELREGVERQIDFGNRAARSDVSYLQQESRVEVGGFDELEKCSFHVGIRYYGGGVDLIAVL